MEEAKGQEGDERELHFGSRFGWDGIEWQGRSCLLGPWGEGVFNQVVYGVFGGDVRIEDLRDSGRKNKLCF